MNRFAGIIITVVAIAALIGAALGWRFPFPGQNRTANQLRTSPQTTQQTNQTRLRATQPTNSARNTNQTTAQVPNNTQTTTQESDVTVNPEATGSGTGQAETGGQPVSAFW